MEDNMELKRKFEKYISKAKKLETMSDEDKLYLYANYKQANFGNNDKDKPLFFNRVETEKWKAWHSMKDVSTEEAMKNYIKKVKSLYHFEK